MSPVTKAYLSFGLVLLAVFEFWAAMRIFGKKGPPDKSAKLLMRMHRIGGYVFLVYFIWISWVCIDMMDRLAKIGTPLDARAVFHTVLAMGLFVLLLLKISFVRFYRKYQPSVPILGMALSGSTLVLWGVAGWIFLIRL